MSQNTANAAALPFNENEVRPKTQWGKIVVASLLGGVTSVVLAPTIAASAPIGVGWLIASNVAAGVVGSVTTKVASNAIGAEVAEVDYNPHRAQLRFRVAIINHFDIHLDPVIDLIRSNLPGSLGQETKLNTTGSLVFLDHMLKNAGHDKSSVVLRYRYDVIPQEGCPSRPVEEGAPPLPLPVHHENATAQLRLDEPGGVMDGVAGAVARGAVFGGGIGFLGQLFGHAGPLFERMFVLDTAPGMNMVFSAESISAAADPLCNLIPGPSSEERAAYFIELIAEIQHHIHRVSQCAMSNGVGLVYRVELGIHHEATASAPGATATNEDAIWNVWESKIGV